MNFCIKCFSPNMSYGEPLVKEQALSIELPMTCNKCSYKWIDIYTFNSQQLLSGLDDE
jgi:hypothetical protein